jgi:hypothetical protein
MDSLSESLDELDVQKSAGHLAVIHLRSVGTAARYQHRGEPLLGRSDFVAGVLERVPVDLARLPTSQAWAIVSRRRTSHH